MQLNKILKGFTKTLTQLDTFIKQQDTAIAFNKDEQEGVRRKGEILQADRNKAVKVKQNIEGMIS